MKKIIQLFILSICLTSCDCLRVVSGQIIEKSTQNPIQGITIYNKENTWKKTTTDSLGNFQLSDVVPGGLFRCPPMKIIIEGNGYVQKKIKIKSGGHTTIKLERSNIDD